MTAPTLYFLTVTERLTGGFEIWEHHTGQCKGCVPTDPQFVDFVRTEEEALTIVNDWELNPPLNGVVEDVDWEKRPSLPDIHQDDVTEDFCGTYSDMVEMVLSICELSNIKAYRVIDDDGKVLHYTFEVVE